MKILSINQLKSVSDTVRYIVSGVMADVPEKFSF